MTSWAVLGFLGDPGPEEDGNILRTGQQEVWSGTRGTVPQDSLRSLGVDTEIGQRGRFGTSALLGDTG